MNFPVLRPHCPFFHPGLLLLGLMLALAPAARAADPAGEARAITKLSTFLAKQAAQPDHPARAELQRYAEQFGPWLANRQFNELEVAFIRLRTLLPEGDRTVAALLEQAEAALLEARAQARAKDEGAYQAIEADFIARFNARAPAADLDTLLKRIAGLAPQRGANDERLAAQIEGLRNYVTQWQDYLIHSANGNNDRALSALDSLVQLSTRQPIIPRSQLMILRLTAAEQLKKNPPTSGADKAFADLQHQLGQVLGKAAKASDLDEIVAAIRAANRANPNHNLLSTLQRTALRWQDYYAALDSGNSGNAANTLNGILSDDIAIAAIPRSKILAMHNLDRTNAKLKDPLIPPAELTLDNLDVFRQQVAFRRNFGVPSGVDLEPLVSITGLLAGAFEYLGKRQPVAVLDSGRQWILFPGAKELGSYAEPLTRIRRELVKRALVMYLEPPADLPPADDEFLAAYSARLVEQGRLKHDWPFVLRILTAAHKQRGDNVNTEADLQALGLFVDGLQNERAGRWGQAVIAYYKSLYARSPQLPAEEIGEHLAKIKQEHPDEFGSVDYIN